MRDTLRSALIALIALLAACGNAGVDLGVGPLPEWEVRVLVFLDRDGSGGPTNADTVFRQARVALLAAHSDDTLRVATSDDTGLATFADVPVGEYRVRITPASIGDSIIVEQIDSDRIRIEALDSVTSVLARLSYPSVSIRDARALPLGKRVFIRGIILSGVQSFRDTTSHVADTSGTLRLTQVSLAGGLTGNNPGDSVSVLGLTGTRAGQPVLTQARIIRLGTRPAPIPIALSTLTANGASAGTLDAAFVQVTGAIIADTATAAPDFRVTASDGSGNVVVLLDGNLVFLRAAFQPGRSMDVRGVLVPAGDGTWVLKPRGGGDVVLN